MRDEGTWVAVFILGLIGLNWPVLGIFGEGVYPYLLAAWLVLVLLLFLVSRAPSPPSRKP